MLSGYRTLKWLVLLSRNVSNIWTRILKFYHLTNALIKTKTIWTQIFVDKFIPASIVVYWSEDQHYWTFLQLFTEVFAWNYKASLWKRFLVGIWKFRWTTNKIETRKNRCQRIKSTMKWFIFHSTIKISQNLILLFLYLKIVIILMIVHEISFFFDDNLLVRRIRL